jgi:hypothetical protein
MNARTNLVVKTHVVCITGQLGYGSLTSVAAANNEVRTLIAITVLTIHLTSAAS